MITAMILVVKEMLVILTWWSYYSNNENWYEIYDRYEDDCNIILDVDEVTKSLLSQCYEALDNNMGEVTANLQD